MVVAEGYLSAHDRGGVPIRPVGYDNATLLHELRTFEARRSLRLVGNH
jgi:hypothetical protein